MQYNNIAWAAYNELSKEDMTKRKEEYLKEKETYEKEMARLRKSTVQKTRATAKVNRICKLWSTWWKAPPD